MVGLSCAVRCALRAAGWPLAVVPYLVYVGCCAVFVLCCSVCVVCSWLLVGVV